MAEPVENPGPSGGGPEPAEKPRGSDAFDTPDEPAAATRGGFRSGFAAVVGRPNVGKSTLVNRILGQKVSIVSTKPQTTRNRVAGVLTRDDHQLVLLDMPGFQRPRDALTERMQLVVDATLEEVDVALFVLNGQERIGRGDGFIAAALRRAPTPVVVAVNKVDVLAGEEAADQAEAARALCGVEQVHLVSGLTGEGVPGMVEELVAHLPDGPMYYPEGVVTDRPEEFLIAELIREKAIGVTEEEVPHAVAVEVLELERREDRDLVYIRAAIYVERPSQRPIILGEAGTRIKAVGSEARRDIERLLGSQVFLELVVKVRRHWRTDGRMLDRLGL